MDTYTYDIANRLIDVNGVTYTWDDNGNLLNDGINSYTYTSNKLSSISGENLNITFQYRCNGLSSDQWGIIGCDSDRVSQTVDGVTTDYVLDIASPLTQVLQDGTNTYVYGVDRIAQMNGTVPEYFLTDGLGSVRQLVDGNGAVTLAKSYDPYGTEVGSLGNGLSNYGFTGEMTDPTGLIYLRSRYYSNDTGRFLTRDIWDGDAYRPISYNAWLYGYSNPIKYTDPTGRYVYDRVRAASYAMAWDHQPGIDPKYDFTGQAPEMDWTNQCTLFASSVLHYGGVRDPREDPNPNKEVGKPDLDPPYWNIDVLKAGGWQFLGYADKGSWYNTDAFYKFATKVIGTTVLSYDNPPQYINGLLWGQNAPRDENWESKLRTNRALIQEGDLVFYGNGTTWDHVAIVVGWGLPTSFGTKSNPGSGPSGSEPTQEMLAWIESLRCRTDDWMMYYPPLPLRPIVVERSGSISYTSWRSLENTSSPISFIEIVHVENR